jgi:hypothetical protein
MAVRPKATKHIYWRDILTEREPVNISKKPNGIIFIPMTIIFLIGVIFLGYVLYLLYNIRNISYDTPEFNQYLISIVGFTYLGFILFVGLSIIVADLSTNNQKN